MSMKAKVVTIVLGIVLFWALDLGSTIALNLITGGGYSEFVWAHQWIGRLLFIVGVPCCVHYIRNEYRNIKGIEK